jgi:opacity protein-like surface antigen
METGLLGGDPPQPAAININRRVKGFGADVVLSAPLGERFSIFGRVGAFRSNLYADAQLEGNIVFPSGPERSRSGKQDETIAKYGVGADWKFSPRVSLRLDWERYANVGKKFILPPSPPGQTGEANMDALSLGLAYRFR